VELSEDDLCCRLRAEAAYLGRAGAGGRAPDLLREAADAIGRMGAACEAIARFEPDPCSAIDADGQLARFARRAARGALEKVEGT
jgi:hypothetical protein